MKPDVYFNKISSCGWFDFYPENLIIKIRDQIEFAYSEEMSFDYKTDADISCLCLGLAIIGDSMDGIFTEGDYTKYWINDLIENLMGIFKPSSIIEKWEKYDFGSREFKVSISFISEGKTYTSTFDHGGDWTNPSFFTLLNEAIQEINKKICLIEIPCSGTDSYYAYTSLEAFIDAYKKNLLPQWRADLFDQEDSLNDLISQNPLNLPWYIGKNPNYYRKNKKSKSKILGVRNWFRK